MKKGSKQQRTSFQQAQSKMWGDRGPLPPDLFGVMHDEERHDTNAMIDFEMRDYVFFIDHAQSLSDLVKGLVILSPFADDALAIAESMSEADFEEFKQALLLERRAAKEGGSGAFT